MTPSMAPRPAFSSFRMEPQYMIAGESAGVAAALAAVDERAVHDVPLDRLQDLLRRPGQILTEDDIGRIAAR